jgi:hypothetical protein
MYWSTSFTSSCQLLQSLREIILHELNVILNCVIFSESKKQYQQAFEQTSKLEEIIGVMKSEERTEKSFFDILILRVAEYLITKPNFIQMIILDRNYQLPSIKNNIR